MTTNCNVQEAPHAHRNRSVLNDAYCSQDSANYTKCRDDKYALISTDFMNRDQERHAQGDELVVIRNSRKDTSPPLMRIDDASLIMMRDEVSIYRALADACH
ncbi:hypothetical protein Tco_0563357 [Tanacetum coccineum]